MIIKIFDIISNHYNKPKASYFVDFVISNLASHNSGGFLFYDILMVPYKKHFAASSKIVKYNLDIRNSKYDKNYNSYIIEMYTINLPRKSRRKVSHDLAET